MPKIQFFETKDKTSALLHDIRERLFDAEGEFLYGDRDKGLSVLRGVQNTLEENIEYV